MTQKTNRAGLLLLAGMMIFSMAAAAHSQNAPDEKMPLIFSHDGAPDDIAAMLYLSKAPNIEVVGVVMSYGEQHPKKASQKWSSFLYEVLDMDTVPLAVGSELPIDPSRLEFPADWRSSADEFQYLKLPTTTKTVDPREGYQLIIDLVNAQPGKVTILVTGAQTDVALALQHDPTIKDKIKQIVIMGGAFRIKGNIKGMAGAASNDAAEWNIFVDALAAKQVFNSGIPLIIVPLDGSDSFWITSEMHKQLLTSKDPGVMLISQLWAKQFDMWGGDFLLWDILAASAVDHPENFTWEYGNMDVITDTGSQYGQTVSVKNENGNSRFAANYKKDALAAAIVYNYTKIKFVANATTPSGVNVAPVEKKDNESTWVFESTNPNDWWERGQPISIDCKIKNEEGLLTFSNTISKNHLACDIKAKSTSDQESFQDFGVFEIQGMLADDNNGKGTVTQEIQFIGKITPDIAWQGICGIISDKGEKPQGFMSVSNPHNGNGHTIEFSERIDLSEGFNQWHKIQLSVDKLTLGLRCLVDDKLIGSIIWGEAELLRNIKAYRVVEAARTIGAFSTSSVKNVIIQPKY